MISIFLLIRIQEAKMLRIQRIRIRILSTVFLYQGWGKQILVPNLDGMTPIEIAERAGFSDLASILRYCQE